MRTVENYTAKEVAFEEQAQISIIIAVYNIENFLEKCVASVLAQTYTNLEIILVDDGSTDGSGGLCDRLAESDQRIRVLHKTNGGLSAARNAGTDIALGTYIAYVDGDDSIEPQMYAQMYGAIAEFGADIAVCSYKRIYRDRVAEDADGRAVIFECGEALQSLVEENEAFRIQNAAWNKLYKRELIERPGKQRFPVGRWYEDIVYTALLLSKVKRCVYLDLPFYNYVIDREGSIMNTGMNIRVLTDQIPAYHEKTQFLRSIGEEGLADIHNYFFYKRLLLFYTQFARSGHAKKKQYCRELREIILGERESFAAAFAWSGANPGEEKKMKLFICSATLYRMAMFTNDSFIIPLKIKIADSRKE